MTVLWCPQMIARVEKVDIPVWNQLIMHYLYDDSSPLWSTLDHIQQPPNTYLWKVKVEHLWRNFTSSALMKMIRADCNNMGKSLGLHSETNSTRSLCSGGATLILLRHHPPHQELSQEWKYALTLYHSEAPHAGACCDHIWEPPVLRYHIVRENYPYPFWGVNCWLILHNFSRQDHHITVKLFPFTPQYGILTNFYLNYHGLCFQKIK